MERGAMKRRRPALSPRERAWEMRTAIHEAGHAVISLHYKWKLVHVSLEPDAYSAGRVITEPVPKNGGSLFRWCVQLAGGMVANHIHTDSGWRLTIRDDSAWEGLEWPPIGDRAQMILLAKEAHRDIERRDAFLARAVARAFAILRPSWPAVRALARALVRARSLDHRRAVGIVDKALGREPLA
jgi:hypothetical protein